MRTIVVGDIHGCLDEFEDLLHEVKYQRGFDRLVLLGDLVDRGPQSVGVVKHAMLQGAELVLGNHDDKLVRYYKHRHAKLANPAYKNPMKFDEERENICASLSVEEFQYLSAAKPYIYLNDGWVAVHAGVLPGPVPVGAQDPRFLRIVRYVDPSNNRMLSLNPDYSAPEGGVPWFNMYNGPLKVIYGHWVTDPDAGTSWTYPTDLGCVFGRYLGAWVFKDAKSEPELKMVPARKAYCVYDAIE